MARGMLTIFVDNQDSGRRLDTLVTSRISDFSRSRAADLITEGAIRVGGIFKKPGYRVKSGDEISISIPPPKPISCEPEPINIDILYEDEHLIAINKQHGIVVHPAPGHDSGTLVNALLYHCPGLKGTGIGSRPGIVHRLDKDTSGVMVVAKNDAAHDNLSLQFKLRKINKKYLGLVYGKMESESGTIALPIGRHPVDRKRMSTKSRKGRTAETIWHVKERFYGVTLISVELKTGRTHQIRVHCAAMNHPIVGDPVYDSRKAGKNVLAGINISNTVSRQMLHARRIEFTHPVSREIISIEAPLPRDMEELINELRKG